MTCKLNKLLTPTNKRTLTENDPDPIVGFDPNRSQPILGGPGDTRFSLEVERDFEKNRRASANLVFPAI